MVGDIETGSLHGNVTVGNSQDGGYTPGDFVIGSAYDGTMRLTDEDGYDGRIVIAGGLTNSGRIEITGRSLGSIDLGGDLVAPAHAFSHEIGRCSR